MITEVVFRCDGCMEKIAVSSSNVNSASMLLHNSYGWTIKWGPTGSLHYCQRCEEKKTCTTGTVSA